MLYGTMPNIGAASAPSNEATLIVLASPVWDYFAGGAKPLRIYVEDQKHRTADHLGMVKTGGNYAAAMGPTLAARDQYKVDQVLFCPGGSVQENRRGELPADPRRAHLTRSLDSTFCTASPATRCSPWPAPWDSRSRSASSTSLKCWSG